MAERTMADVRRRAEDMEPSITIHASDPYAVNIMRGIAGALGKRQAVPGTKAAFEDMAIRMQAWLDSHRYELLEMRVLLPGEPRTKENPLGQCVVMVKIVIGPRHPGYRIEHRVTARFDTPARAVCALYGDDVSGPPAQQVFDDAHGWQLCDSHGDPIASDRG